MAGESSYVDRPPTPALAAVASSVWIQQVGDRAVDQRHVPHGGAEVRCVLGEAPRLIGPLTASTYRPIPSGGVVVGVRLRPGAIGALAGPPAEDLVDGDLPGGDLWSDQARLEDLLGDATSPRAALDRLESFLARSVGDRDPLVTETVRRLTSWSIGGTAGLSDQLSISPRQLRRRCRAAVGVGPKELHRILRFGRFIARVQASVDRGTTADADLARWAVDIGYHDQAHLSRECRRLAGSPPGEVLAQYREACTSEHDHLAAYRPTLRAGRGRFVQERRTIAT